MATALEYISSQRSFPGGPIFWKDADLLETLVSFYRVSEVLRTPLSFSVLLRARFVGIGSWSPDSRWPFFSVFSQSFREYTVRWFFSAAELHQVKGSMNRPLCCFTNPSQTVVAEEKSTYKRVLNASNAFEESELHEIWGLFVFCYGGREVLWNSI